MKCPSIYTDLCLKQVLKNAITDCNSPRRSFVNSAGCELQLVQGRVVWLATRGSQEGIYDQKKKTLNFVTIENKTHINITFVDLKDLGNHLLRWCSQVMKHPVWRMLFTFNFRPPLCRNLLGGCKTATATVTHSILTNVWTEWTSVDCVRKKKTWNYAAYQNTIDFHSLAAFLLSSITLRSSTLHVFTACYFDGVSVYQLPWVVQTVSIWSLIALAQVWAGAHTCESHWRTKWL